MSPPRARTHRVATCPHCNEILLKPDRDGPGSVLFSQRRTVYRPGAIQVRCPGCRKAVSLDPSFLLALLRPATQEAAVQRPPP